MCSYVTIQAVPHVFYAVQLPSACYADLEMLQNKPKPSTQNSWVQHHTIPPPAQDTDPAFPPVKSM